MKKEAPNFIYIPTFNCNLNCYYCFEKAYEKNISNDIDLNQDVNKIFDIFEKLKDKSEERNQEHYSNDDILFTITGGEPLLESNKIVIEKLFDKCKEKGYFTEIVTNGTTLDKYVDVFRGRKVGGVQVTLDGGEKIHNSIRKTKNGEETFEKIINNINLIKDYVESVVGRINVNKINIDSIKELYNIAQNNSNVKFYTFIMQQEGCHDNENILEETEALRDMGGNVV